MIRQEIVPTGFRGAYSYNNDSPKLAKPECVSLSFIDESRHAGAERTDRGELGLICTAQRSRTRGAALIVQVAPGFVLGIY